MKVIENNKKDKVDFAELKTGACFKDDDNDLMMKLDGNEQKAVNLRDGYVYDDLCGDMVTPVNAEVRIID